MDAQLLEQLPETLTVEQDGKSMPIRDHPFVKEAKDWPTFAKTALDAHREVGARVRIPGKDAKPEDVTAFKTRLIESGILPAPLKSPDEYGLVKPDTLPDGLEWNEEGAKKLAAILHKHGAPKALAGEILALKQELELGRLQSLKVSREDGEKQLKAEHGTHYDERKEAAGRLASMIFKSEEELAFFEKLGLGNHPAFLSVMMRLAPLAQQDSTFLHDLNRGGGSSGADVKAKLQDIMTNPQNPDHKLYWQKDKATLEKVEKMYKAAYGEGKVELT